MHFLRVFKVVVITVVTSGLFGGFAKGMGFCAFKKKFPTVKKNDCDVTRMCTGSKVSTVKPSSDFKEATNLMAQTTGGDTTAKQSVTEEQTKMQSTSYQQTTDSATTSTSNISFADLSTTNDAVKSKSTSYENISYQNHTAESTIGSSLTDLSTSNNVFIVETTLDQQTTAKSKVKFTSSDSLTNQSTTLTMRQTTSDKVTTKDQLTTRDIYLLTDRLTTKDADSFTRTFDRQTAVRSTAVKSTIDSSFKNRFTTNHMTKRQPNSDRQTTWSNSVKLKSYDPLTNEFTTNQVSTSKSSSDEVTVTDTTKTDGIHASTYPFTTKDKVSYSTSSDQETTDRSIAAHWSSEKLETNQLMNSQSTPNRPPTDYSTTEKMDSIYMSTPGILKRHLTSTPTSFDYMTTKESGNNEGPSSDSPSITQRDNSPFTSHQTTFNKSTVDDSDQPIGVYSSPDQFISDHITAEQTTTKQITSSPTATDQNEAILSTVTEDRSTKDYTFTDCSDIHNAGYNESGVYSILPSGWNGSLFYVYCDMITDGGGWTVFQRRVNGSTNFYKTWVDYRDGFGDIKHEFWLGNQKLHILSHQTRNELRVDFLHSSTLYYTKYTSFKIGNESSKYIVADIGAKSGNGGSMHYTQGKKFSTYDQDNDGLDYNCAEEHRGGWWYGGWEARWSSSFCYSWQDESDYRTCSYANLNGDYNGKNGENVFDLFYCNITYTEMKIRRAP